jgi:hypothetical protein
MAATGITKGLASYILDALSFRQRAFKVGNLLLLIGINDDNDLFFLLFPREDSVICSERMRHRVSSPWRLERRLTFQVTHKARALRTSET